MCLDHIYPISFQTTHLLLTYPASSSLCLLSLCLCLPHSPTSDTIRVAHIYLGVGPALKENGLFLFQQLPGANSSSARISSPTPCLGFIWIAVSLSLSLKTEIGLLISNLFACMFSDPIDAKGLGRQPSHAYPSANMSTALFTYSLTVLYMYIMNAFLLFLPLIDFFHTFFFC